MSRQQSGDAAEDAEAGLEAKQANAEKPAKYEGQKGCYAGRVTPRRSGCESLEEPKFTPAFYKAVGTTLVANDLDQANRIAFGGAKRWRVVTLAGQLINASGTMSGGGNHVACGGMSSKLEEAQKDLRSVEVEAERLTQAGPNLDMDIEKLPLDIKNGRKRVEGAGQHVRDLKAQGRPDARDVARINALAKESGSSTTELELLQTKHLGSLWRREGQYSHR
ncbi:hypothetical protein EDC04DRAFT_2902566 [Pisolithus marmoratus]|nr:hypothetical protein EDC04DRAFT_2902566 [Pisolithus marmoratus]